MKHNRTPLTLEEIERVKELVSKGYNPPMMAEIFDRSKNSMAYQCRKMGLYKNEKRGAGNYKGKIHRDDQDNIASLPPDILFKHINYVIP